VSVRYAVADVGNLAWPEVVYDGVTATAHALAVAVFIAVTFPRVDAWPDQLLHRASRDPPPPGGRPGTGFAGPLAAPP